MDQRVRFELLYAKHAPAVKAYVLRRAHPSVADDLVAEVFLVCWRGFGEIPADPLPWLFGVARRVLSTQRRSEQRGAAAATALTLANSQSSHHLNVVSAAYAAVSPERGLIEAVFVRRDAQSQSALQEREWIDVSNGTSRVQAANSETTIGDGWVENWSGAAGDQDVVHRTVLSESAANRAARTGSAIEAYRQLYMDKSVQLVGQESWHGRLLWKLEGPGSSYTDQGKTTPIETVVVLVDPSTYLPVLRKNISLTKPGHPVESETELVKYKHVAATAETRRR